MNVKIIFMKSKIILSLFGVLLLVGCGRVGWQHGQTRQMEAVNTEGYMSASYVNPDNIVLLLPLKGKYAATSKAVRNGFLAAYYHARKKNSRISIKIVDTTNNDVGVLYQAAIAQGADVVVGPLIKNEVEELISVDSLPVPVIALNTLDDYTSNYRANFYQFGLLPQDEATQVADKMMVDNSDRVAIIYPDGVWGEKIVDAFKNEYENSGGDVVAALSYNSAAGLPEQMCYFLAQDPEKLCVPKKKKKKKDRNKDEEGGEDDDEPDSSENMRRQDINAIFLVSNEKDARQIIPLLKFYYAGDLPVYSISTVYSGVRSPNLDRDLDGVTFCDMPWALKKPGSLGSDLQMTRKQIISLWSDSYNSYSKLYALGVDAYMLATNMNRLLDSAQYGLSGASGRLYLDNFNHIYRQLRWARMRNGVPRLLLTRKPSY